MTNANTLDLIRYASNVVVLWDVHHHQLISWCERYEEEKLWRLCASGLRCNVPDQDVGLDREGRATVNAVRADSLRPIPTVLQFLLSIKMTPGYLQYLGTKRRFRLESEQLDQPNKDFPGYRPW